MKTTATWTQILDGSIEYACRRIKLLKDHFKVNILAYKLMQDVDRIIIKVKLTKET